MTTGSPASSGPARGPASIDNMTHNSTHGITPLYQPGETRWPSRNQLRHLDPHLNRGPIALQVEEHVRRCFDDVVPLAARKLGVCSAVGAQDQVPDPESGPCPGTVREHRRDDNPPLGVAGPDGQ